MKRWLAWMLILVVLLSGCTQTPAGNTTGTTHQTEVTQPQTGTLPGLYVPESMMEVRTFGAVHIYPLDGRCTGIAFMGEDLLVALSTDDGATTLMLLSGQTCVPKTTVKLDCEISFDSSVSVTDKAVGYYHGAGNSIVLLNEKLQEIDRISMPDGMIGEPVLSSSLSEAYYCIGEDIRGLDLKTGVSRLIRRSSGQHQTLVRTVFSDTILECFVDTGIGTYTEFLSVQTGESVGTDEEFAQIATWEDTFYLERMEGAVFEQMFGTLGGSMYSFMPASDTEAISALLAMGCVLSAETADTRTKLSLYDLQDGKRKASVLLEQVSAPCYVTAEPSGQAIWLSAYDHSREQHVLYRWEIALSTMEDDQIYTGTRYTRENPDTQALAQLEKQAQALGDKYGVQIYLNSEVEKPDDYTFVYEYQTEAFRDGLAELEKVLAAFPQGFLWRLSQVSNSRQLKIGLVREMYGAGGETPTDVVGLQYWLEGNAYIALNLGGTLEQAAYHELAHVLDTYVLNNCSDLDVWDRLNPEGFEYYENYTDHLTAADNAYLEGAQRAFIDAYSMTYAKEDRARIFEYAMLEGCAEYFESETMQAKLKLLCEGIRDACNWEKDTRTFPWEQYLKEPLAYTEDK